jgi:DNA-binding CsgD family transcriptional regulator
MDTADFLISGDSIFQTGTSARHIYDARLNRFLSMDESMGEITGITSEEFLRKTPNEALSEVAELSHIDAINDFYMRSMGPIVAADRKDKITLNIIYNIRTTRNENKRIHVKYRILEYEGDIPVLMEGITTDITHIQKDGLPVFFLVQNNKVIHWEEANPDKIAKNSTIPLSRTEINLLRLISSGLSPEEIAQKMHISISTIYTHRKNIKSKMRRDINYAIALLREKGIIS